MAAHLCQSQETRFWGSTSLDAGCCKPGWLIAEFLFAERSHAHRWFLPKYLLPPSHRQADSVAVVLVQAACVGSGHRHLAHLRAPSVFR